MRLATSTLLLAVASHCLENDQALSSRADYTTYIEPIRAVDDFGVEYSEDGAGDATVLLPRDKVREPILALLQLGQRGIPLLIECLVDGRVTAVRFNGNTVSRPMRVPLGYVCLDILLGVTRATALQVRDCADDGMGACIDERYYFRPDDYSRCWPDMCLPRPWVRTVQNNWRRLWLRKRIHFKDPYRHR